MKRTLSLGLLISGLTAAGAAAQTPDLHWNDWMGCWDLVADGNVARLPPAENAAGGVTGPIRPGSNRSARVCVSPTQGGAQLRTFVGGEPVLSQTIIADGVDHPVSDSGCTGTQRARWSEDGLRLFTRAQVTCDKQPARTVTGMVLMAPDGDWVDVQAVTIGDTDSVRVRRYRAPQDRRLKGVPAAAVRLQIDDVKEAGTYVSPRAIEAALMETSARFPLSSRVLMDLNKSGVDERVIDLMVALSYPSKFSIRPSGPDDRLTPPPPFLGGADFIDASYEYPWAYPPFYSNYYYSPYFFSPFGYSYLRYYGGAGGFFSPVIVPGDFGGGGGGGAANGRPPENGRVVNGKGYTVVDRRGDIATSDGGGGGGGASSTRSSGSSRGTVSPRGYSAGGDASSGATGSSSGGGASGGGGSAGGSSGGDTGRTAVPK